MEKTLIRHVSNLFQDKAVFILGIGSDIGARLAVKFSARGAQVECGPIGCRPLPPGCRQVSLGGRWLDNNGLRVVCDPKRN